MSIEERVARLERQNRRLKQGLAVVVLVVAGAVIMGATRQTVLGETVSAHAFVVKDKSGKIRATFAVIEGVPSLNFYDTNGRRRVSLVVTKDGSALGLLDANGIPRIGIAANKAGPVLQLYDTNKKRRVGLIVTKDGSALSLYDKNLKRQVSLGETKDGPALELYDTNKKIRASLSVNQNGASAFSLHDSTGTRRILLGVAQEKGASIILIDAFGKPKWGKTVP